MDKCRFLLAAAAACLAIPAWLPAQRLKPETVTEFDCYTQAAESRMAARQTFLAADSNPALLQQLMRGPTIHTVLGNGPNPHKVSGAMLYDWIGTVFIPGATVSRTVAMLQDYDHRARYFSEVVATSKLLCRTGENRFGFTMRLKEPAVIDTDNDVVWERVDAHRWRCRSYSTRVQEIGTEHGYLLRLNSYWRFAETDQGVFAEGQTITLSGEFGSVMRSLGSMMGHSPEKALKKSLGSMRESLLKPGLEFAAPPAGIPACGAPVRLVGCNLQSSR